MKKKKLNHLNLKKRTISNLNSRSVSNTNNMQGGNTALICTITVTISLVGACTIFDDTIRESRGCETDSCEDTYTCPDYSCFCTYD